MIAIGIFVFQVLL